MRNRLTTVTAIGVLTVGVLAACADGDDDDTTTANGQAEAPGTSEAVAEPRDGFVDCHFDETGSGVSDRPVEVPPAEQPAEGSVAVEFTINDGLIPMTLDRASAPCTVAAVTSLVEQDYYDDTPCHRITVSDQPEGLAVLQCGDPTGAGTGGPGFTIQDEPPTELEAASTPQAALYPRGTVAMAKTQMPDSAGSQFFLVYDDSALPPEYAVLGTIDEPGLEVLDEITAAGAKSDDPSDPDNQVPRDEVQISEAMVLD